MCMLDLCAIFSVIYYTVTFNYYVLMNYLKRQCLKGNRFGLRDPTGITGTELSLKNNIQSALLSSAIWPTNISALLSCSLSCLMSAYVLCIRSHLYIVRYYAVSLCVP